MSVLIQNFQSLLAKKTATNFYSHHFLLNGMQIFALRAVLEE